MIVRVRWFASLADRTGAASEEIEVPEGADVSAVWKAAALKHPALEAVTPLPLAACDLAWSPWDRPVLGVAEVAFLPPFSGG